MALRHTRRGSGQRTTAQVVGSALLAATGLVGCVGIPSQGPVQSAPIDAEPAAQVPFEYLPPGPALNAGPRAVVMGFLNAMTESPNQGAVAREFLTASAAQAWQPDRATWVYRSADVTLVRGQALLRLRGLIRLSDQGRLLDQAAPDAVREVTLRLVRDDDQWRIEEPPDGLILPLRHFETRYLRSFLYYFDPSGRVLMPTPVYQPVAVAAPTQLVRALMRPQAGRDRGVLRSFIPADAELDLAVPVNRGVARVSLSSGGAALREEDLTRIEAQFVQTLSQVAGVSRVEVAIDGREITAGGLAGSSLALNGEFLPFGAGSRDLYALTGQGIVAFTNFDSPLSEPESAVLTGGPDQGWPVQTRPLRSFAVGPTGPFPRPRLYGVSQNGQELLRLDPAPTPEGLQARPNVVHDGTDLRRPEVDALGQVWFTDVTSRGVSLWVVVEDDVLPLALPPNLRAAEDVIFAVSTDGSLIGLAAEGILWIGRIQRDQQGVPQRLLGLRQTSAQAVDLAWTRNQRLAVLSNRAGRARVSVVDAEGGTFALAAPTEPDPYRREGVRLIVPAQGDRWVLRDRDGQLASLTTDGEWQALRLPDPPGFLAYPG